MDRSQRLAVLAVAGAMAILSLSGPRQLHRPPDEDTLVHQATAIAATGHDASGLRLPLYIHAADTVWLQPVRVYATALFVSVVGPERGLQLPPVVIGMLDVILIYIVALELTGRTMTAVLAAAMLALTPAHFLASRTNSDAIYPVAFICAWLACLAAFLNRRRPAMLSASLLCLGLGVYSHATAVLIMPACALLTGLALRLERLWQPRLLVLGAAGFLLPLLLLAPWYLAHPHSYIDTVGRWGVHPAYIRNPLEGVRAATNWGTLSTRLDIFWHFLDPSFLFFTGASRVRVSGPQAGVFLFAVAPLLLAGLWQPPASSRSRAIRVVMMSGVVTVALVASTFNQRQEVGNILMMLPFIVLLAAEGAGRLLTSPVKSWRWAVIALLVAMPLEFAWFAGDAISAARRPQTTASRSAR